jgi:hypothetical protein
MRFVAMLCMFSAVLLYPCFSNGGRHTTGGMQRVFWWCTNLLGNYTCFHNFNLTMLIASLKLFKCT